MKSFSEQGFRGLRVPLILLSSSGVRVLADGFKSRASHKVMPFRLTSVYLARQSRGPLVDLCQR
jgi:hypothetical protein